MWKKDVELFLLIKMKHGSAILWEGPAFTGARVARHAGTAPLLVKSCLVAESFNRMLDKDDCLE